MKMCLKMMTGCGVCPSCHLCGGYVPGGFCPGMGGGDFAIHSPDSSMVTEYRSLTYRLRIVHKAI